ncbi:hypothetical protein Chor_013656 [Crotalus horridus]
MLTYRRRRVMVLYTGSRKNLYVWLCWLHVVLPNATRMAVGAGRRKMSESDEGSKGPEKEGNQNGIHKREKPRGKKRASSSEGLLQPVKLGKSELYKIEELLKEVTLKEKKKQRIDAFLHEISAMLRNITDQSWLPKGVKVPILQVPFKVKGKFHFLPPAERYHRKRALYLAHLAQHLAERNHFGSVAFAYANGNHLKPLLLLQPQGVAEPPTPHYNNSILWDLVMETNLLYLSEAASAFRGFQDGVALLKVWLRQRELYQGLGCFNGFIASMLVGHLLATHKISKMMSGYQVLRNALHFLATTDLTTSGISLSKDTEPSLPSLTDFHQAFQVVFVDSSGLVNLCADMTANTYKQLLFMTPKPLIRTFDHVFHLRHVSKLQTACKQMQLLNALMDRGGSYVAAVLPFFLSLLERGLARRLVLLAHQLPQSHPWPIHVDPPKHKDVGSLSFGLLLNLDFATSVLERGPEGHKEEAVEFRQFWGEKSELRRFQDGVICEAVLWNAANLCQKRLIPEQIIRHILKLHLAVPETSISYTGALLEPLLKVEHETFPPVPMKPDYTSHVKIKKRASFLPVAKKPCPAYVAPIKGKGLSLGWVARKSDSFLG